MRKLILAAAMSLAATTAFAADVSPMPVKAPPRYAATPCTVNSCTGFYVGADVGNSTGTAVVPLLGGASAATNGQIAGIHGGYELYLNNFVASAEGFATLDFDQNFGIQGIGGLKQEATYGFLGGLGVNLASTFGLGVTSSSAPTIPVPQQLLASLMSPQVKFGEVNRHGQWATAAGLQAQALIATNWTFDGKWLNLQYNGGTADNTGGLVAGTNAKTENLFLFGVSRHFAIGN